MNIGIANIKNIKSRTKDEDYAVDAYIEERSLAIIGLFAWIKREKMADIAHHEKFIDFFFV